VSWILLAVLSALCLGLYDVTKKAAVGLLLLVADKLYFTALATEGALVGVVSIVRRTSVVISFDLGSVAFREQLVRPKALALLGVVAGLWLLAGWISPRPEPAVGVDAGGNSSSRPSTVSSHKREQPLEGGPSFS
jgi:hypothetical protein